MNSDARQYWLETHLPLADYQFDSNMHFVPTIVLTLLLTVAYTSPLFESQIPILNSLPPNAYPAPPFSLTGSDSSRTSVNPQFPGDHSLGYLPDIGSTILDSQATNPVSPLPQYPGHLPDLRKTSSRGYSITTTVHIYDTCSRSVDRVLEVFKYQKWRYHFRVLRSIAILQRL